LPISFGIVNVAPVSALVVGGAVDVLAAGALDCGASVDGWVGGWVGGTLELVVPLSRTAPDAHPASRPKLSVRPPKTRRYLDTT